MRRVRWIGMCAEWTTGYCQSMPCIRVSNAHPAGPMWPVRSFFAAHNAFWEFSNNYYLCYLVY